MEYARIKQRASNPFAYRKVKIFCDTHDEYLTIISGLRGIRNFRMRKHNGRLVIYVEFDSIDSMNEFCAANMEIPCKFNFLNGSLYRQVLSGYPIANLRDYGRIDKTLRVKSCLEKAANIGITYGAAQITDRISGFRLQYPNGKVLLFRYAWHLVARIGKDLGFCY
jgi:hypothetical protein